MVQASQSPTETENLEAETESEERVRLHSADGDDEDSARGDTSAARQSPREALANSLRAHTVRLRTARIRAEFEQTLMTVLALNVVYMYYIDHKLLILIIRACQIIRLFYFPYSSAASQRGTAALLLVSNLPVILIHTMLFTGPDIKGNIGEMLFINFIGPEPKSLAKILTVDFITISLEAILLQSKWELESFGLHILSALPVPISEPLMRLPAAEESSDATERSGGAEEVESSSGAS